jgi:L-iditol 2-dehydrogenase
MKQAIMLKPGDIRIQDVPAPVISKDEVLVRVKRIGVCGSDIHVYHGQHPYTPFPVVQGHELSCEIVEIGENVKGFSTGDKVTIEPQLSCGKCYSCETGLYNLCDELKVIGFQAPGAASELYAARGDRIVKLDDDMSHADGAMVEPLAVAVRAVGQAGDITGKNVLVLGAGPIGNLVAQTARGLGAKGVLISDINPFRLEIAKKCGIERTLNPDRKSVV